MTVRIPDKILEDILSRVNIAEIISGYIPLKKAGSNFKANCPFHNEKTPSFMVNPEKNIYHCFGCGAGGNAFGFLMKYEHLQFREAVEILAQKAGVVIPYEESDETRVSQKEIYRANTLAMEFYHRNLMKEPFASAGREFLSNRKISKDTAERFKIGFSGDSWDSLISYLRANKVSLEAIEKSGLVVTKTQGGYYDRFRQRIMFPVLDNQARVVAFGARSLQKDVKEAKYINSPETSVYIKGNTLFGLNYAKEAIRQNGFIVLVEGYFDMITPFQSGFENIVAASGTAFTSAQARVINRYTKNVVLIFDADSAGEAAMQRSLDIFIQEGLTVEVCVLEQGHDPDSFVREKGIAEFNQCVQKRLSLYEFKMQLLKNEYKTKTIESKAKIAHEMLVTLSKFKDEVIKSEYIKRLSQDLEVEEAPLKKEIEKVSQGGFLSQPARVTSTENVPAVEKMFLRLLLADQALLPALFKDLGLDDFTHPGIRRVIECIKSFYDEKKSFSPGQLLNYFEELSIKELVTGLSFDNDDFRIESVSSDDRSKMLQECVKRVLSKKVSQKREFLAAEIRKAQGQNDQEHLNQLLRQYNEFIKNQPQALAN